MTALVRVRDLAPEPARAVHTADDYIRAARAENTLKGYVSDLHDYLRWLGGVPERYFTFGYERLVSSLREAGVFPVPLTTLEAYLVDLSGRVKFSTLTHRLNTLQVLHQILGFGSLKTPRIRALVEGIARKRGTRTDGAAALPLDVLLRLGDYLAGQSGMAAQRDRTMLLTCFAGGFRRAELVALDISDVTLDDEGYRVLVRRSKTDAKGQGITKAIRRDVPAFSALESWLGLLQAKDIFTGRLFRSINKAGRFGEGITAKAFEGILKARLKEIGIDEEYSPHSLRSGFVTSAYRSTQDLEGIMRQTGHRSLKQVVKYIREAELFNNPALAGAFLSEKK